MKINFSKPATIFILAIFIILKQSHGAVPHQLLPIDFSKRLIQTKGFYIPIEDCSMSIENCVGNACGSISITQGNRFGPDRLTIKNVGTQSVVLSIRFYYAGCQNAMTFTLSAYESEETVFVALCPPYNANYK